ncbi:unnamed protein product [Adineta ricciae]|uniref:NHL repeat containing protein n=1 Tax=Adineta ricciae TaxID=249248 RepID=A0A815MGD9_ADIRI|nr:unnamed protein product [Adineta ricciae]
MLCNNDISCRIYDINALLLNQCRLFQGDINLHAQSPILGSPCQQNMSMCREDINYTCLRFNQCGPLKVLEGTTIVDGNTVIAKSVTVGLSGPTSILVNKTVDNAIIVVDSAYGQVISFHDDVSNISNVTLVAKNWTGGNMFNTPYTAFIHSSQKSVLYVTDYYGHCVYKIDNMQVVSPVPNVVAGVKGSFGNGTNKLYYPYRIAVDSAGNLYITDSRNHRVMRYAANATSGVMIAGTGTSGSDSLSLNRPYGMYLDEDNSYIYVVDALNSRIQRFSLSGGSPNNGTTVAGGNGNGLDNNQLYLPFDICLTKNKRTMYIADTGNNRIVRWNIGEASGVNIAGDVNGNSGSSASMFDQPYSVALNDNETFLYVADKTNSRIIRFELI